MIELLAWVEVNKKKLLIGAAIGAVAIGAWSIYGWHRNQAEAEANAALFKVDAPGTGPENTPGPSAETFLQVAARYPGTSAGGRALLFAADALFRAGKFGEAKTQFENFLRDYAEHPLAATAAFGVGACLDAMNKTNEALVAYQDVLTRHGLPLISQMSAPPPNPNAWTTAITQIKPNEVRVRGYDIAGLMGRVNFGQAVYLILRGELPSPEVGRLMDAMLVAST